jgi:hypothetical protein
LCNHRHETKRTIQEDEELEEAFQEVNTVPHFYYQKALQSDNTTEDNGYDEYESPSVENW